MLSRSKEESKQKSILGKAALALGIIGLSSAGYQYFKDDT